MSFKINPEMVAAPRMRHTDDVEIMKRFSNIDVEENSNNIKFVTNL